MTDVAFVSGGAGGIGRAIAARLVESGYVVVSADVAEGHAPGTTPCHLDVTSDDDVEEAVGLVRNLGPLKGIVNCAGLLHATPLDGTAFGDVEEMVAVNLVGTMRVCTAMASLLDPPAAIVNIGSIASVAGGAPGVSVYGATKAGLEGYTRALACEAGRRGIRVNLVAPGFVLAPMSRLMRDAPGGEERLAKRVPLRRLADPSEIAEAVEFLLSDRASYVNGVVLPVDGGVLAQ